MMADDRDQSGDGVPTKGSVWRTVWNTLGYAIWIVIALYALSWFARSSGPFPWIDAVVSLGIILGAPIAFMLIYSAYRKRRPSRAFPAERCIKCGYDLTGVVLPRCPECGALIGFTKTAEELGVEPEELGAHFPEHEKTADE